MQRKALWKSDARSCTQSRRHELQCGTAECECYWEQEERGTVIFTQRLSTQASDSTQSPTSFNVVRAVVAKCPLSGKIRWRKIRELSIESSKFTVTTPDTYRCHMAIWEQLSHFVPAG